MATDIVTNGSDDAAAAVGSLRYELAHAQYDDTSISPPVSRSVTLGSTLTIAQNVTIDGGTNVTITGSGANGGFSDFTINQNVSAKLDHLTIRAAPSSVRTRPWRRRARRREAPAVAPPTYMAS